MKRLIDITTFAAAICCLAACQSTEETFLPDGTNLTAIAESDGPDTRTVLSQAGTGLSQVLWSEEDQLDVFMDGSPVSSVFTLAEGAGTKKGVFHGMGTASRYIAFYPHSMLPSVESGEIIRFTLPATQQYAEGTFASGSFPMMAVSTSSDLQFRNLCSVLRISMTGHDAVTRVVFRSNDPSAKVSGKASVSLTSPSDPSLQLDQDSCDSLVLSVPSVKLDESEATHLYLVLPPQTYKGGFTLRVYTGDRFMEQSLDKDFTMKRSRLHKADSFVFKPNGIDTSTYLEGSGTEEDPFLIGSLGDLILMRDAVNSESGMIMSVAGNNVPAASAFYQMVADIDLDEVCGEKSGKSWTPIGTVSSHFKGVFDGKDHRIYNLYINKYLTNQGLFSFVDGTVKNLTVNGIILDASGYMGLLTANLAGSIENCEAFGLIQSSHAFRAGGLVGSGTGALIESVNHVDISVSGGGAGGIIGSDNAAGIVLKCMNYGAIKGVGYVGGIGGSTMCMVEGCLNYGTVSGTKNAIGGIVGYESAGMILNCSNFGEVQGATEVGGVAGESLMSGYIVNSVNYSNITGTVNVGGICGIVSNSNSRSSTTILNSLNLGTVSSTSGSTDIGGISGTNEGVNTTYGTTASRVEQCYWLYDPSKGLGMEAGLGKDEGFSSHLFSLTDSQMKGSDSGKVLYSEHDSSYTVLLDALNAWAYANRNLASISLQGWTYGQDGYPALTGLDVQMPGAGSVVFTVSDASVEINASTSCFEVTVVSSLDYTMTSSRWISEENVSSSKTNPYIHKHLFRVEPNSSLDIRNGEIVFTNTAGNALKVLVMQKGVNLETDTDILSFTENGGVKRLVLSSSASWTVSSSDPEWCIVDPQSGNGDSVVSVHVSENVGNRARAATLTVSSQGGIIERIVSVVQSGKTQEVTGDWKKDPFVHKSLAMRFTATWCGWCPRMNKSFKRAMELYPGKISYVALHNTDSDLAFNQVDPLNSQYGISGFPTGIIDGRVEISNDEVDVAAGKIVDAVKETEEKYGTVTGVEINSSLSGRVAKVDVGVYVKKAGDYKITVLLLEDGIIGYQANYEGESLSNYVHDNIARVAMSNVQGDAFSVASDNTVKTFSFNTVVPSSCVLANLRVLVYVQRAYGSYPVIQSGNYGRYFVDNSADVALGESLKLALEGSSGGGSGGGGGNEGIVPGGDIDM